MRFRNIAATILAGSAGMAFAADPGLLSLAMPDSRAMIGVNIEQVRLSPFGQYLIAQIAGREAGLQTLVDATGFDPRRDLREVLLASPSGRGNKSGLVAVRGTFDVAKIVEVALTKGQTAQVYKGVEILGGKGGQGSLAFLDPTLAIAGDDASVRAAIDRRSAGVSISSDLAAQVNQLSTTEDIWFVTMVPPSQLQVGKVGNTLDKVQQAGGGLKFGANVVLTAQTVSQTDKDAAALAETVKMLASFVQMSAPKDLAASAGELLQNLNVAAAGQVTTLSLSVPEQQVEQMIKAAHNGGPIGFAVVPAQPAHTALLP
jgi:hypothetical protein